MAHGNRKFKTSTSIYLFILLWQMFLILWWWIKMLITDLIWQDCSAVNLVGLVVANTLPFINSRALKCVVHWSFYKLVATAENMVYQKHPQLGHHWCVPFAHQQHYNNINTWFCRNLFSLQRGAWMKHTPQQISTVWVGVAPFDNMHNTTNS